MSTAVLVVVSGYAALVAGVALVLGLKVRRPRHAPGALGALAVLVLGGLATSLQAFFGCFAGGALVAPAAFFTLLGAWGLALALSLRTLRRLARLAAELKRRRRSPGPGAEPSAPGPGAEPSAPRPPTS